MAGTAEADLPSDMAEGEPQNSDFPEVSACLYRPAGVTKSETNRRSFVDAAWDKFNGDMAVDDCIGIYMPKKGPAKITDSGHLILPWRVHMTDCGITEAGQHSDMASMCRNVTELDLAQNNITSLEEVIQVISSMPQLTFLNLTNNPLHSSSISLAASSSSPPFHNAAHVPTAYPLTKVTVSSGASTPTNEETPSDQSAAGTEEDLSPGLYTFQRGMEMDTSAANTGAENLNVTNANVEDTSTTSSTSIPAPTTADITSTSPGNNNIVMETTSLLTSAASATSESSHGPVDQPPLSPPVAAFSTLRQLVLNDTGVEWQGIVGLLRLFPSLEELHLSLNQYKSVEIPDDFVYPSLARLFFNNNDICSWSHICRLGHTFPGLQHLFLAETSIASLEEEDDGRRTEVLFPSLMLLSLNKSQLRGWEEVDHLRRFPSLCDVRLQGIPFLEAQDAKLRRQQLVARLPNITRLNGSSITAEERLDAERAFIRLFMDEEEKPERYHELVQVYGQLDPLVKVNLTPKTLFNVIVVMGDHQEPFEVNTSQTVRDLKKSLQNIAGMPSSKFHLFYLDKQSAFGADKLKYPDKKLYTYNVADGDEFIIQPKE